MTYDCLAVYNELMDIDTANVVWFYETKDDALATVREAYERYGPAGVLDLALTEHSEDGSGSLLAEGEELARLAMATSVSAGTTRG